MALSNDDVRDLEDAEGLEEEAGGQDLVAELFGESDSDEEAALPSSEPQAPSRKDRLEELAQKKRKEAAGQDAEREQHKRQRRTADAAGTAGLEADNDEIQGAREAAEEENDEEEEGNEVANEADRAFIDDEGVEQEEGAGAASDSDEERRQQAPEAEEAEEEEDEFERMFAGAKGRRRRASMAEDIKANVDQLLAHMEVAAEKDMEANKQGKPAVMKLKMLPQVEDKLAKRGWHDELLASGILGVLKAWIEPLPDGNLPNIKIRTAVLRMLQQLPVDVADGLRKEQLKKSELGKVVMFLYRLPDESQSNRRIAKELIERWSRPIFEQYRERREDEELRERELQMRQARAARQKAQAAAHDEEEAQKRTLKRGDPGFRWHASIPQPARLDYLKRPESKISVDPATIRGGPSKATGMAKKLKQLNAKKSNTGAKAAKMSIEGRGLLL
ncbi:Protein IWS1 homolog [Coccomyxa sp. Obi]|nr:Protein IWS1 homolog [Coccomyxa sp. Obi]